MTLRPVAIALLATVSVLAFAVPASAAGYQVRENSAAYQGTAFAGQASGSQDLSVMFANPATMTQFSGSQIEGNATEIVPRAQFTGSATTTGPGFTPTRVTGSDAEVDGGALAFVPAIYGMTSITPDLKAGISITAPFGLMTRYDSDWVGRYNALRSELLTIDINPSVAYRVLPWLSIGGGVSAQHAQATLTRALNLSFLGQPDGNFRVDGDSWGFGFNGGVLIQPLDGTRIGLAYRSQVYHRLEGDADFTVSPVAAAVLGAAVADSGASAEVRTPSTATASLTQRITPNLDVMADFQWTNWQVFDKLVVQRDDTTPITTQPENWRNSWFAALGAAWRVNDQWTLRSGIAFDKTPERDETRTARLPDQDRYWLSLGVGYKLSDALSFNAGYTHIFIPSNSPIDETAPGGDGTATPTGGRLVGSYDAAIDIVSLAATFRF
jgi:long-chain fatty acid transport protein